MMQFPTARLRRRRGQDATRNLLAETTLTRNDLICPFFVVENESDAGPVASMPGVMRHTVASLLDEVARVAEEGIRGILLFGVPASKSTNADEATRENGVVCRALQSLREVDLDVVLLTDVCVCSYTTTGHCGVVRGNHVDNDETLPILARMALAHAKAGADFVAPSAMMDGQVREIRSLLDAEGFKETGILAYAAKYASSFYGPFREAADSAPQFGDRRSYQMNPANRREALAEIEADIREGADMVMVKPALAYMDVICESRRNFPGVPILAYHVSGEYAMIKAAAEKGWIDERRVVKESMTSLKRAGADAVITYFAGQVNDWLEEPL